MHFRFIVVNQSVNKQSSKVRRKKEKENHCDVLKIILISVPTQISFGLFSFQFYSR